MERGTSQAEASASSSDAPSPWAPTLFAAGLAAAWLLPGLGVDGLWSDAELPVLDRVAAALGEARTGMLRSPFVPDALRSAAVSVFGDEFGLRLPHALAAVACTAAVVWLALTWGLGRLGATVAAAATLSMPVFSAGARTAIGNPFGECFGVWALIAVIVAARADAPWRRATMLAIAAALLAGAVASAGLVLGGLIPLLAIAAASPPRRIPMRWALGAAIVVIAVVAVVLVRGQGDGYIPLLGAAKDLELVDKPELRRFSAALSDLGHQSFPWLPLGLVGVALGRDRALAGWLLFGLVVASAWSLVYGRVDVPLRLPLAIGVAAAVSAIAEVRTPRAARRAAVLLAALGMLVLAKDLELAPEDIAAPLHAFAVNAYPADTLHTAARLGRFAKLAALALFAGLVLARHGEAPGLLERLLSRVPARLRDRAPAAALLAAALVGGWQQSRSLLGDTSAKLSPKRVLSVFTELATRGEVGPTLASHRVRDPGLAYYGPPELEALANRRDIFTRLAGDSGAADPTAVLLRTIDLPAVYQQHRLAGADFFVLDDSHATLRLVSNVLPEGRVDRNRIPEVLSTEPFVLEHETFIRFEEFIEIIGWQVDGPLVRGRTQTLQLSIRVLRPLPGGAKIFARFLGGRLSRINPDPQPIAEDLYPCNLWRAGDYVLHRYEFVAPPLEILPGEYDFVIGLRRGESKNFEISAPTGELGEFDVRIEDPKRAFAKIGRVQVW